VKEDIEEAEDAAEYDDDEAEFDPKVAEEKAEKAE